MYCWLYFIPAYM